MTIVGVETIDHGDWTCAISDNLSLDTLKQVQPTLLLQTKILTFNLNFRLITHNYVSSTITVLSLFHLGELSSIQHPYLISQVVSVGVVVPGEMSLSPSVSAVTLAEADKAQVVCRLDNVWPAPQISWTLETESGRDDMY